MSAEPTLDLAQQVGLPALFVVVALGALVPVLPTGAAVSAAAAAAVAAGADPVLALVFLVATVAAWTGDAVLYALVVAGGHRFGLGARLRRRTSPERLRLAERRMDEHGLAIVVVSRLLPAGRIPVMLAAAALEVRWRRFAGADAVAAATWAACYATIGAVGGFLVDDIWAAAAVAVLLAGAVALVQVLWRRPVLPETRSGPSR